MILIGKLLELIGTYKRRFQIRIKEEFTTKSHVLVVKVNGLNRKILDYMIPTYSLYMPPNII